LLISKQIVQTLRDQEDANEAEFLQTPAPRAFHMISRTIKRGVIAGGLVASLSFAATVEWQQAGGFLGQAPGLLGLVGQGYLTPLESSDKGNVQAGFLAHHLLKNNIPEVAVARGDLSKPSGFASTSLSVPDDFFDLDGDALTYSVTCDAGLTCSIEDGNTLHLSGVPRSAGTASVHLKATDQAGSEVVNTFVVTQNRTDFADLAADTLKTYGDAVISLTTSATSGEAVTVASSDPIIARVKGSSVEFLRVGTVWLIATSPVGDTVRQSLRITPKTISVTANAQTKVYGSMDPVLSYVKSDLLAGDTLAGSLSRLGGESIGKYAIGQGTLSHPNYAIAFTGSDLVITPKSVNVVVGSVTKVYGETDPTFPYTLDGVPNGAIDPALLSAGIVRIRGENVGTYPIGSGTTAIGNFVVNYVGSELTITPKPVSVTAEAKSMVYGAAAPALTYTQTGLLEGDVLTGELARTVGDKVGTYPISVGTIAAGSNYKLVYTGADFTVTPAKLKILASNATKLVTDADPVFTAKYSGFVNGETPSVVTGLVLTRAPGTVPGTYAITPSGAVAENYSITFVNGTLTITEPTTNITAKLRRPVSKLLEARVPSTFARPSLNGGRGDVGLNVPGCDPYTCLSVDVLLPQSGEVSVSIFDNLGVPVILWCQVVSDVELASLPKTEDGRHVARLTWNLRSESGRAVPEGVYLWKLEARLKDGTKLENVYKLGVKK
jgi:hypothetical protein